MAPGLLMVALGFGIIWVGYAVGFTGYCWVKGYNVSFKEIVSPTAWYTGTWPPALITDPTQITPSSVAQQAQAVEGKTAANQGRPVPGSVQSRL